MIGDKIKKYRKLKKLTQKELAEITGISLSAIEKYERGKLNPSYGKVKTIALALDVDLKDIIPDDMKGLDIKESGFERFLDVHGEGFMYNKAPKELQDKFRDLFEQCLQVDLLVENKIVEEEFDNPVTVASIFYDYISRKQKEHNRFIQEREDLIRTQEKLIKIQEQYIDELKSKL